MIIENFGNTFHPKYIELATKLGTNTFNCDGGIDTGPKKNVKFLDEAIARGNEFILSNSAFGAKKRTSFYKELQYMDKKRFKSSEDGMK